MRHKTATVATFFLYAVSSTATYGAEPGADLDLNRRLQGITAKALEAQKAIRTNANGGKANIRALQESQKKRDAELEALAAELEALPAEKQGFTEHATLADVYLRLRQWDDAIEHSRAAIVLNADAPAIHAMLVQLLADRHDVDAAEKAFAEAIAACTDKAPLELTRYELYRANSQAKRPLAAAEHLAAYLSTLRPFKNTYAKSYYLRNLDAMSKAYFEAGQGTKALDRLDSEIAVWDAVMGDQTVESRSVGAELRARKIRLLDQAGDHAAAEALLKSQKVEVQATLVAQPEDLAAVIRMDALLEAEAAIAPDETKAAARLKRFQYVRQQFTKHPESSELAGAMSKAYATELQSLVGERKIDEAQVVLKEYQAAVAEVPEDLPTRKTLAAAESSMKSSIRRFVSMQVQVELIGKPMIPLDATVWVNGTPLAADDLKGKVVLLDFWAVWCGPCRATFPHLIEWHEKYANDGLVIVGLTRYYQYGWDAEEQKHVQVDELSPADEAVALAEFTKHHELKHRLAFMPEETTLPDSYGVSGIPHVVVIDRQGVIRMIRVGSGEPNAHDLETLIEELVHGSPPAASGE